MPGVGKTTRARMLYNHGSIEGYFDKRAWCVVSQTYQKRNVLIDILASLSSKEKKDNNLKIKDEELALDIHKILKRRRYLIIIDDVWCTNVWDDLNRYFPDDLNGSRIMFTSRIRDTTPVDSIFHTVSLLGEEQSWSLLQGNVFPKEPCPPQLLGIGKRIAAKCGGLPLAVVVAAGILANLEKEESIWEKVEKKLDSTYIFDDDTNNCSKILELSYKHLPNYLKPCFLYFGTFPEDKRISVRKLTWLWIAEGFIQREQYKSPEHLAEEYLLDLINRSLLLIVERRNDGGIKACIIHDLLREMCLRIAYKENFFKSTQHDNFSMYEKHHRLCVHSTSPIYGRPFGLNCRSLFGHFSQPSFIFPQMKLLRVMDLLPVFDEFYELERIDLLVQLRYLAVDRMPKPLVDNLVNLEVLCVESQDDEVIYIPSCILRMVNLRHLRLKKEAEFEDYRENSQMENLRSFSFVHIDNKLDEEILNCSPNLLKLKCKCTNATLFPDLTSLTSLESLKMVFKSVFIGELTEVNFPSTIKELTLSQIGLPWGAISILGTLPNLHVLKLEFNSFWGYEWETSDGEFQELRFLKLERIDLVQWITCSEHFPKLQFLVVNMCLNLKNIPKELGDISTLQKIEMINCEYWPCISAVQIELEQRENGNEELQVIITTFLSWSKEQLLLKCREIEEEEEEHENRHEEFNASITCSDNLSEEEMADYVLGSNPMNMSYLVGYGSKYPQYVHHRGASIPTYANTGCTDGFKWLNSTNPNPNVAVGALVGGPFLNDTYIDSRNNSMQGEPTTYSNAAFIGLLSGLITTSSLVESFI
ncbi:hypothetical protein RD792_012991 [Penstemon davidsonii]|uniref:Endoglucanase n=1 Tax=Penstemon davidsonii TaxID=160366 RepID=A0ABR0CT35_9LAMI|nr:hypothetical protein RD792_012991 [Penstemon davidsonii]